MIMLFSFIHLFPLEMNLIVIVTIVCDDYEDARIMGIVRED